MMAYNSLILNFCASLNPEDLVITPTNRLASLVQHHYQASQKSSGRVAWKPQNCFALKPWLERCWQQSLQKGYNPSLTLLTQTQAELLWHKILGNQINLREEINQAAEWIYEWGISRAELTHHDTPDQAFFIRSFDAYHEELSTHHWLHPAQLFDYLTNNLPARYLPKHKHIHLIGFNPLSLPLKAKALFERLEKEGAHIHYTELKQKPDRLELQHYQDKESELASMLTFAKKSINENKTLVCVVPDLISRREELTQAFIALLNVETKNAIDWPFNIAGGEPLSLQPAIATLLNCLDLVETQTISAPKLMELYRSPFFVPTKNLDHTIHLLSKNLYEEAQTFSLTKLVTLIEATPCIYLANQLKKLLKFNASLQKENSLQLKPSEWQALITEWLIELNWPGEFPLSSNEYQTIQQFQRIFSSLATLDIILNKVSYNTILSILKHLLHQQWFQPKTNSNSKIQVVGLLEAGGLLCDHLWVMSANHKNLPAKQHKNPFIPLLIQKKYALPNHSPDHDLSYCRIMTDQLKASANKVIFSYSEFDDDEHLSPSPLLKNLKKTSIASLEKKETPFSLELEALEDDHGLALNLNKSDSLKSGVDFLKRQALCPFQAYATHRLEATPLAEYELGISHKTKGILLHKALELFWKKTKTQTKLNTLTEDELSCSIHDCIQKASEAVTSANQHVLLPLEKKRLASILKRWLEFEKNRPSFCVTGSEIENTVYLKHFKIQIKVDRVDLIKEKHTAVIDYKTQAPKISSWDQEKLIEPQLPLYATSTAKTEAIAFAEVGKASPKWAGYAKMPDILPGNNITILDNWDETLANWQERLVDTAEKIKSGYAVVDPYDQNNTCNQCRLQSLCRINRL